MNVPAISWSDPSTEAHRLASVKAGRKANLVVHRAAHAESERGRPMVAHIEKIRAEVQTATVALAEGFRDVAPPDELQRLAIGVLDAERQAEALRLYTGTSGMTLRGGLNDRTAMAELDALMNAERLFASRWALAQVQAFRDTGESPALPIDELSSLAQAARREIVREAEHAAA